MMNSTRTDVAVLQTKLESIHVDIREIKYQLIKQNGRIGKLESWQSKIIGALGVLGFLIGAGLIKIFS